MSAIAASPRALGRSVIVSSGPSAPVSASELAHPIEVLLDDRGGVVDLVRDARRDAAEARETLVLRGHRLRREQLFVRVATSCSSSRGERLETARVGDEPARV